MAKYEVTHRCTHTEVVTLFGPHKDRDRKIEWLSSLPCPECASIDRINSAAAIHELQEAAGLPRLVGSEKQVAWAVQIRQDFLVGWKKIERKLTEVALTEDVTARLAEQLLFEGDAFVSGPLTHADGKYWIDNRENLTESAINSHLYAIRHQLAEEAKAIVGNLPITDDDKREVIRMALEARQASLEARRTEEATRRNEAAARALAEATAKQQSLWERKDRLAAAVHLAIGDREAKISTYYKDTEKRIYLDTDTNKACLYVTGNNRNRPGSIDAGWDGKPFPADQQPAIRAALEMADKDWKNLTMHITPEGKASA